MQTLLGIASTHAVAITLAFYVALVAGPAGANSLEPDRTLAELVRARLVLMQEVAAYKWRRNLPIEDLAREEAVLVQARRDSLRRGLQVQPTLQFFQLQMDAAKEIQQYWFNRWREGVAPPSNAPDLKTELRPALSDLGGQILAQLGRGEIDAQAVAVQGLSQDSAQQLAAAASGIRHYPDVLAQVLDSGTLRVGTTGDYAPFSEQSAPGQYMGIDIDMARDLAGSLDASIEWVPTTWPTLMADFQAGLFDIGMSGISINLQRQRVAFFSAPYHTGGKTPIARCADAGQFDSLAAIDQDDVQLVVNPGGTNQRFVQNHIRHSQVRVHPDNRTIFEEIRAGRADVMITDQIEVALQSAQHPDLCPAMPGQTLTHASKGYLLPRDTVWKNYIDTWLAQRHGDGTLTLLFKQYIAR